MIPDIKKAVTFRASSIGDCLMGKYLLENIHTAYPKARCALVIGSRGEMIKDLFTAYPWLEVIEVNRRHPLKLLSFLLTWRGPDVVVTQYTGKGGVFSTATKLIARLIAKKGGLIGFEDSSALNNKLYDKVLPFSMKRAIRLHEVDVLKEIGIDATNIYPTMRHIEQKHVFEKFSIKKGAYIVIQLFSGSDARVCSPARRQELIENIARVTSFPILLAGSASEAVKMETLSLPAQVTIIAGKTTLQELMTLIGESTLVVSLDTGMAHLTAQLNKKLILLFSCLGANWWFPEQYGKHGPMMAFSRKDPCASGHILEKFPPCLNEIDFSEVARSVVTAVKSK